MENKKLQEEEIKKEIVKKLEAIHDIKYLKLIKIFVSSYKNNGGENNEWKRKTRPYKSNYWTYEVFRW